MNSETRSEPLVTTPEAPDYSVPWQFIDNWIGVALLGLIDVIIFVILLQQERRAELAQSAAVLLLELSYLLPVIFIFAWRGIHWKYLRFGSLCTTTCMRSFPARGHGTSHIQTGMRINKP